MQYFQMTPSYAPAWGFGGPIRLMYEYASWMLDEQINTIVYTSDIHHDYSRIFPKRELLDGIQIIRLRMFSRQLARRNINLVSPAMLLIVGWRVYRSLSKVILHTDELRGVVPMYAMILKLLFPRKVYLVHSAFGMLHYKRSTFRCVYDKIFLGTMLRRIDMALAQNEHELHCYQELFVKYRAHRVKDRIMLLPLHVEEKDVGNISNYAAIDHRINLRKKYNIPESAFVVIFLGRLHPSKGIIRAIDVFEDFTKCYDGETYFLIVGRDDGMQEQLERYIDKCAASMAIRIVNNVFDDRFDYYTLADLFVGFPTIDEETMLSSVEALSCGTPILVSREADIPFVEEGGAGFVIDFTNEEAVQRMHEIAGKLYYYREQTINVVKKHFSRNVVRVKFIEKMKRMTARMHS